MKATVSYVTVTLFLILTLFYPSSMLAADVSITELMYNLEGTDTDREWVEIHNISGSMLDLDDWYFYENDTDHYLNPADGADGDGNSLQRSDGGWSAADPTPASAASGADPFDQGDDSDTDTELQHSQLAPRSESSAPEITTADIDTVDDFSVSAGSNIQAIAGVKTQFAGVVSGVPTAEEGEVAVRWSFGNGEQRSQAKTFYAYPYSGEYVATFTAKYQGQTRDDRITIDVAAADISITTQASGPDGYIALENNTGRRVDLSGWHLRAGGDTFTLPENTIHLAGETLTITNQASDLSGWQAALLFPDGTVATSSSPVASGRTLTSGRSGSYQLADTSRQASAASQVGTTSNATEGVEAVSTTATSKQESRVSLASTFDADNQSAAAAGTVGQAEVFWRWAGLLVALAIAGIGIVVLLGRVSKPADSSTVSAAEFDINEL